ncbi:hypothetical protein ACS0TY_027348 [Phlomoides rotata]
MSVIGWNCRGLGNPQKVPVLKCMINKSRPSLVFLSELLVRELVFVARKLGFDSHLGVDCGLLYGPRRSSGRSWNSEIDVEVTSYSTNHIDVTIHNTNGDGDWRFTGIYGWPEDQQKWKTWHLLDTLAVGNSLPWLCVGDFNEIMFQYEKQGGSLCRESRMEEFRQCLERNSLIDLSAGGNSYTWSNM